MKHTKLITRAALSCCLFWSAAALAEVPAGGDPNPSVETEEAPDASVAPKTWLKQSKRHVDAAGNEEGGVAWPIAALVLLSALGGGALFMKYKKGAPSFLISQADVRVVSTTRLSPKASLIVADIHGRPLLLGVTEHAVSELGWLDLGMHGAASEQESNEAPYTREAPAPRGGRADSGRFADSLSNSMARGEEPREAAFRGNPNVAALIAANAPSDPVYTRKAAGRSQVRAVHTEQPAARVEDQVAGLMRRRR